MSGDELIVFVIANVLTLWIWGGHLRAAFGVQHFDRGADALRIVAGAALVALLGLYVVLNFWASWDVRDSAFYLFFYMALGTAMTGLALLLLDRLGLSVRDDVIERRNPAAAWVLAGAIIGAMAAFAGANIGDGPGWWVVVFCAFLSLGSLLAGWKFLDAIIPVADQITIDRSVSTALRCGGWFLASGAIFGRAAAGNWQSADQAITDFVDVGSGALVLLAAAILVEWRYYRRPSPSGVGSALGIALLYLCSAIAYLIVRGHW
jgi:hypothetical protein